MSAIRVATVIALTSAVAGGLAGCADPQLVADSLYDCSCRCAMCDALDPGTGSCTAPHSIDFGAVACARDGGVSGAAEVCSAACSSYPSDLGCSLAADPTLRRAQACAIDSAPRVVSVESPFATTAQFDPAVSEAAITLFDGPTMVGAIDGTAWFEGGDCSGSCPLKFTSLDLALSPSELTNHSESDVRLLNNGFLSATVDATQTFILQPETTSFIVDGIIDGQPRWFQGPPSGRVPGWIGYGTGDMVLRATYDSARGDTATFDLIAHLTHRPPVAVAEAAQEITCGLVHLEGSRSYARDGAIAAYAWYTDFGTSQQKRIATGQIADVGFPVGSHTVTLLVRDEQDRLGMAAASVTVAAIGTTPQLTCPAQLDLECDAGYAVLQPSVVATDACGPVTLSCTPASGTRLPVGSSMLDTCLATSAQGATASCSFPVTVRDTLAPVVKTKGNCRGMSATLWPPDKRLHKFSLSSCIASVTDRCDGVLPSSGRIIRITSDEPNPSCQPTDMVITDGTTAKLRAERSNWGDGRVYTVFFEVADRQGNRTTASCKVGVPLWPFWPAIDSGTASCVGSGCG